MFLMALSLAIKSTTKLTRQQNKEKATNGTTDAIERDHGFKSTNLKKFSNLLSLTSLCHLFNLTPLSLNAWPHHCRTPSSPYPLAIIYHFIYFLFLRLEFILFCFRTGYFLILTYHNLIYFINFF